MCLVARQTSEYLGIMIDRDLMMISVSRECQEDQKGKESGGEGRSVVSEKTDSFH